MARALIAGIAAGVLIFAGGFLGHMFFGWVGRSFSTLPDESRVVEFFRTEKLAPGVYGFPNPPANYDELSKEEQAKAFEEVNDRYKEGPAALIVVAPTGQDMMGTSTLLREFTSNLLLGVILAIVIRHVPGGFGPKFAMTVLLGFSHWLAVSYSYQIWYRYPSNWIVDELYCSLLESALAGIALGFLLPRTDHQIGMGSVD